MLYYLLLPILSILLIVLQSTVTDLIFSGRFIFEISLIVVVYAGFRLDLIKGTVLAFVLGLTFDCLNGSVTGVLTFLYIIVFWFSFFISEWLDTEKAHVILLFTLLCAFLKEIILNMFYYLAFNVNALPDVYGTIMLQALVIGLFAPLFFSLMDRTGIFIYEKKV
ncbi:MAG: rod shape-determining protein MreD [Deltaproteobacteria bacterium]|nr:rod shape-determining protein MreD [Deltaproteobacteria bacterium]